MTDEDRDKSGKMVDRYRQASAELDERPSASLRASIVAAAAREVGARPISADTLRRNRPRWPLAAAAAVMLSTLAVMMATRTNEEMPQFHAPPEAVRGVADSVATPAATAPPPRAETPAAPRAAIDQPALERQRAPAQERSVARLKKESDAVAQSSREMDRPARTDVPAAGRLKKDSDAVEQAARGVRRPAATEAPATARINEMRNNELKNAEQKGVELEKALRTVPAAAAPPAPASPAPAPPPEPAARAKSRAEQSAADAVAQSPALDQASSDARRDAATPAVPAPLSAAPEERKQTEEPAAAWLERIIKLRREGRHVEADAELKRFRERYPQVQPPAEALLPGSR